MLKALLSLSLLFIAGGVQACQIDAVLQHDHVLQPCIRGSRFFNNPAESLFKHTTDALKIFWATKTSSNPYFTSDPVAWSCPDKPLQTSQQLALQWIGHASFLIQVDGFNILTDPIFFDLNSLLYPRTTPCGIDPKELPHIDCVIISHNHRDHLDQQSIDCIKKYDPIVLVPKGVKKWFIKRGFKKVHECSWWEEITLTKEDKKLACTFVPAVHWSGHMLTDNHASLWGGWLIKAATTTTYFAGDSAYSEEIFKAVADYAGAIDYALLPIGPCEPREYMCHSHMSPQEAVAAFALLPAHTFVPMHWGTFGLGTDAFDTPIQQLVAAWDAAALQNRSLKVMKFGERITH